MQDGQVQKDRKRYIRMGMVLLLAVMVAMLAACGQSDNGGTNNTEANAAESSGQNTSAGGDGDDSSASDAEGNAAEAEDANEGETAGPITLHGSYEDVTLEAPAVRVVALEWKYAEELITLGMQPVGVADIEGYNKWLSENAALGADVVDVGTRQEPSLEEIAALEPDLIIAPQTRHEAIINELKAIAPTVLYNPYQEEGGADQYTEMVETFRNIALAVGKEDEGEAVLERLQQKYNDAAERIAQSDLATNTFVLASGYSSQNVPTLRVFTDNGMVTQILERIGLENVYHSDNYEIYGYTQTTVELLTELDGANFIYTVQEDDNIVENQLADNPVWTSLQFVKEDRTYALGGDTWMYGGPLAAEVLVDRVLDVLLGE
ncbi:ABC transporter substrate-binding protein [Paenibacillus sabuli]|uniref:ABC transporter substrate-binding protein n=1 Tax=Paenibacillus sabuli TaxID=2772509 RepID=UPI00295B1A04|nr:iron-siderophore ABC transporter substrate-binding protein [Paenibacillus sabuli]